MKKGRSREWHEEQQHEEASDGDAPLEHINFWKAEETKAVNPEREVRGVRQRVRRACSHVKKLGMCYETHHNLW